LRKPLVARYSAQAELNPFETCEFLAEVEDIGGRCLIFDEYDHHTDDDALGFGLLFVIEIIRSEMEFAHREGGEALIERLKLAEHYPYSDMDRDAAA
jgi:hypothetical protein